MKCAQYAATLLVVRKGVGCHKSMRATVAKKEGFRDNSQAIDRVREFCKRRFGSYVVQIVLFSQAAEKVLRDGALFKVTGNVRLHTLGRNACVAREAHKYLQMSINNNVKLSKWNVKVDGDGIWPRSEAITANINGLQRWCRWLAGPGVLL